MLLWLSVFSSSFSSLYYCPFFILWIKTFNKHCWLLVSPSKENMFFIILFSTSKRFYQTLCVPYEIILSYLIFFIQIFSEYSRFICMKCFLLIYLNTSLTYIIHLYINMTLNKTLKLSKTILRSMNMTSSFYNSMLLLME